MYTDTKQAPYSTCHRPIQPLPRDHAEAKLNPPLPPLPIPLPLPLLLLLLPLPRHERQNHQPRPVWGITFNWYTFSIPRDIQYQQKQNRSYWSITGGVLRFTWVGVTDGAHFVHDPPIIVTGGNGHTFLVLDVIIMAVASTSDSHTLPRTQSSPPRALGVMDTKTRHDAQTRRKNTHSPQITDTLCVLCRRNRLAAGHQPSW